MNSNFIYTLAVSGHTAKDIARKSSFCFRCGKQWPLKTLIINVKTAVGLQPPDKAVILPLGCHVPASPEGGFYCHPNPGDDSPDIASSRNQSKSDAVGDKSDYPAPSRFSAFTRWVSISVIWVKVCGCYKKLLDS